MNEIKDTQTDWNVRSYFFYQFTPNNSQPYHQQSYRKVHTELTIRIYTYSLLTWIRMKMRFCLLYVLIQRIFNVNLIIPWSQQCQSSLLQSAGDFKSNIFIHVCRLIIASA